MATDIELLEAWRHGDLAAGEELFERHYDCVVRFFRSKVPDATADLVQQTFMACAEGRDRIRSGSSFRAYLLAVAHHALCAHLRARYRGDAEIDLASVSIADLAPGPSTVLARRREQRLLLEALRRIPIELQVLLELRYWEQLKTAEIAEILGIPHATVRGRLQRAHKLLERVLAELAESEDELRSTIADLQEWARGCREQVDMDLAAGCSGEPDMAARSGESDEPR